jgi:hypothetical protein
MQKVARRRAGRPKPITRAAGHSGDRTPEIALPQPVSRRDRAWRCQSIVSASTGLDPGQRVSGGDPPASVMARPSMIAAGMAEQIGAHLGCPR